MTKRLMSNVWRVYIECILFWATLNLIVSILVLEYLSTNVRETAIVSSKHAILSPRSWKTN